MKKENHPIYWFVVNLALLIGSMFMTWFIFIIDPPGVPVSGGDYIFSQIKYTLIDYGFDLYWFSSLLEGLGGIIILGYMIFILIKIVRRKVFVGSKNRSIILVVIATIFLLSDLTLLIPSPLTGYWLFIAGILSSAVLEWEYSRAYVNLLTGKRTRKS